MFLIDTDIASYAIKSQLGIAAKLLALAPDDWAISAITFHELSFGLKLEGISQHVRDHGPAFLDSCLVLDFDAGAAEAAAEVRAQLRALGKPTGYLDSLIAGHALALNATLISNNLRHFQIVPGLRVKSWV